VSSVTRSVFPKVIKTLQKLPNIECKFAHHTILYFLTVQDNQKEISSLYTYILVFFQTAKFRPIWSHCTVNAIFTPGGEAQR
jgi:recombinational DNA repair protein RecR